MTRRVYVYFVITFLLGAVVGGSATYYGLWSRGRLQRHGFNKQHAMDHLTRELNLSGPQVQQVSSILDEAMQRTSALQKQLGPQFDAIHQETRAKIRQLLNPDQAAKFDAFVKAMDERHRREGPPPPPPPR